MRLVLPRGRPDELPGRRGCGRPAVVRRHPLDGGAEAREPGRRALEEGDGTLLALVGQDLGVGEAQASSIDVEKSQPMPAFLAAAVTGDRCRRRRPAELFDVEMDQLAGPVRVVADDLGLGLQRRQPAQAVAARTRPTVATGRPAGGRSPGRTGVRATSRTIAASAASSRRVELACGRELRSREPTTSSAACTGLPLARVWWKPEGSRDPGHGPAVGEDAAPSAVDRWAWSWHSDGRPSGGSAAGMSAWQRQPSTAAPGGQPP